MKTLKLLIFGILFLTMGNISAQVEGVNYQLKYDTAECRYDAFVIINIGSANTVSERIQFNSQFSIVVPTGNTVTIDTSYMPLLDNETYTGTEPINWSAGTVITNPAALPGFDLISITPNILSQTYHYNDLAAGDTIKIFSIGLDVIENCGEQIRMFENGVDPSSSDIPEGTDFSNGFTVGDIEQLYEANSTEQHPPAPTVVSLTNACGDGVEIDLTAETSACQGPLTYEWEGPDGYTSTTEDVFVSPATVANNGFYQVTITDAFGCTTIASIDATSKPNAGQDQTMCAGTMIQLAGTSPNTGTWSKGPGGPSFHVTLDPTGNGTVQVTMSNTASGPYSLIYAIPGCADTMTINVDPSPLTLIQGPNNICAFDSIQLISNIPGGTWTSNNTSVATINPVTGFATGVASGTTTFDYTTLAGCVDESPSLTINPAPEVTNTGQDTICVDNFTFLTPVAGGDWDSSDDDIATVTNGGEVQGVAPGTVELRFTDATSGCISDTIFVTVVPKPEVTFIGNDSLCVGGLTQLSPNVNVTYTSSNINVITVDNNGNVTGVGVGEATVQVTDLASGCVSEDSPTIYVLPAPTVAITGDTEICIGENSLASPTIGGTWVSSDTLVATILDNGFITAVGSGPVTFTFTETATGCESTTETLIVDAPPTVSAEFATICIGGTTNLTPSTGGTWTALESDTASVSGNVVEGLIAGTAGFIFNSDATGCDSDTLFVTVEPGATVSITGDNDICIGETTQLSSNGEIGSWESSDVNIATVTNAGVVTGVGAGEAVFTFTSNATLCKSNPTDPVTVFPAPVLSIGDNSLCIGFTTFANSSTFGGNWASNNTDIATINAFTGEITAVAPGSTTFIYTDIFTGCETETGILIVNQTPEVEFGSPSEICEGFTTQVNASVPGIWTSSDTGVATVDNNGLVTGQGAGTADLIFTETLTGCASDVLQVTVLAATPVTDPSDPELCIGETTTVTPSTGGVWVSSDDDIATITNAGVITAVSNGSANFTFTSTGGGAQCASNSTDFVIVNPNPTILIDADVVCVGEMTMATTSTAGIWTSGDTNIATINATTGEITGVAPGQTTFTFVDDNTGCSSPESAIFTVAEAPEVTSGAAQICVGEETNVFPSTGGTWISSNDSIATVTNDGLVTAVSPGMVVFYFQETGGCLSPATDSTEVTPGPDTDIGLDDELCIGETIQILPATGGTWVSSDMTVATITDGGLVTAVGAGLANFTFQSDATGCKSEPTDPVTVHGPISTVIVGPNVICIGGTTTMSPNDGNGVWTSSDTDIATIDNNGVVTGVGVGDVTFVYTPNDTGCPSDLSDPISISPSPTADITGLDVICIGANTTLSPVVGGTWTSSDPSVATVTDAGIVTAHASGVVTFVFNETASGCNSTDATDPITITNCINPDFNATFVDIPVIGDVNTNDNTPVGTTYGSTPVFTGGPLGAVFEITVNPDGTYEFVTDLVGVYTWDVPVCVPPLVSGCQTEVLTITVTDFLDPTPMPFANVDIATMQVNTGAPVNDVTLNTLGNDKCVVVGGCQLDPASVAIVGGKGPGNGSVSIDPATGDITYTPAVGFVGQDIYTYTVCVDGDPTNCATADQVITILSNTALNTTAAADDFNSGGQDTPITGNVGDNDVDPEGDSQLVDAQSITVPEGTFTLLADGSYTFIPVETFFGPVDFPYNTCDDNALQACTEATLHLLVVRDLYVQVRVYLQGAMINNGNETGTTSTRPLMRDGLRESTFTGARVIPDLEPFTAMGDTLNDKFLHWETQGFFSAYKPLKQFKANFENQNLDTKFYTVPDPATIFADLGENSIVDWVSVELRDKSDNETVIAVRSGLVQRDGDVQDLNGESGVRFPGLNVDDYYVVVRHRNHLGAMTEVPQTPEQLTDLVDFTVAETGFYTFGMRFGYDYSGLAQSELSGSASSNKTGFLALWGGDFDGNGKVKFTNPSDDQNNLFGNVVGFVSPNGDVNFFTNFDFAYGYLTGDYDLNGKSKFDNPDDDKNFLFGQLLFYQLNTEFRSNFDFFIEQIPEKLTLK